MLFYSKRIRKMCIRTKEKLEKNFFVDINLGKNI